MRDTFTRLVAFSFRWATGERAHRLTSVLAGLMPDAIADSSRQVMRMLLPLDWTMPDAFPSLFARYGLPPYAPGAVAYAAQIARLQGMLNTHSRAGSVDQLITEAASIGLESPGIEATGRGFWILTSTPLSSAPVVGDTWIIGDDTFIGASASPAQTKSVTQLIQYFKPAADLFEGLKEI